MTGKISEDTAATDIATGDLAGIQGGANVRFPTSLFQPADATLTSLSALGTAADKLAYTTALDTWAEADITTYGRSIIAVANEAAFKALVNLEIGTDVQAQDALLQSFADLSPSPNTYVYFGGGGAFSTDSITSFGRSLIDDNNASTARSTIGVVIGTDVQAWGAVLDDFNTLGAATTDGQFIVATGAGAFAYESGATARASMGLETTTTDNAVARYNGTSGATQNSSLIVDDSGNVSSFGGQIAFPATQNASSDANTLDDYEEGTWTPTTTQSATLTTTLTDCKYTKIGRLVTLRGRIDITSAGTAANAFEVSNFPFSPAATVEVAIGSGLYLDSGVQFYSLTCVVTSSGTMKFYITGAGNYFGTASVTAANGDTLSFTVQYEV